MSGVTIKPGTLLISGLAISDGVFDQAVVLILDHDDTGSLGVVLNQAAPFELARVLPRWVDLASYPAQIYQGGPVSPEGAVCLASPVRDDEEPPGWTRLYDQIGLLHLDTPVELVQGAYRGIRIFAGYAGWSPGQLDMELAHELWHPVTSRYEDVFDAEPRTLWRRVLRRQGGELGLLSAWTPHPELN